MSYSNGDTTITVDLEVNASKAMKTVSDFKQDTEEKLSEISQVQTGLEPVLSTLLMNKTLIGSGNAFDSFADSMVAANNAIIQIKKTLASFSSSIGLGKLSDGMAHMFESAYRTMVSSVKQFDTEIGKGLNKGPRSDKAYREAENNIRISTASGLSASQDMLRMLRIVNNAKKETGLDPSQIGEIMPALYSVTRNKVDEYRRTTRSTPRLDALADFVANEELFKGTVRGSIKGYNPTKQQLVQLAKSAIVATRHNSYRDNLEILKAAGIKGNEYGRVEDQLPEVFREAYVNYGRPSSNKAGNVIYSLAEGEKSASAEVYRKFRDLVRNGNQQAIRLGQQVGLVRAQNGYYQFSGNANMAQMDKLAGLAAQIVGDAKSSLPYHYVWRNDDNQQQKLLNRQNNVFNDALSLMEVLSEQQGLRPDAFGHAPSANFNFVNEGKAFKKFNRKAVKIQTLGVANQYVVPKTHLDENGNIVWRDPSWQKEEVQEKKDDYFATVGNSALTYLLGMYGNNTYGYGRDDQGKAKFAAPKIVRIGTSHLYKQVTDKQGTRMIVDPSKQKEADRINRLFARQETAHYVNPGEKENEDNEYIAAFGDAESLTMIRKKDYDSIVKNFARLGMANPFNNMNTGGLFESGNYKNAAKMIDVSKKKATPGFRYEDLGYGKAPSAALVDFEKLYNYLGIPEVDKRAQFLRESQRIDGLALFDPTVLGVNAQMRAGLVGKFMGQTTDWRRLLYGSHLLHDAYIESRKENGKNRGLIVQNNENAIKGYGTGYSFYMPQIGLSDAETKQYISQMNDLQTKVEEGTATAKDVSELRRIRDTYFYDIMDKDYTALITDSTIKNNDKFRIISKDAFKSGGIFEGQKWAKDRGDGTVELIAKQQKKYFEKAVEMSGGYWINRTGYDFRTDKYFIPESLASAMGVDTEKLKEQSNANYDEYIAKMEKDDNARINFLKKTAYGRRLVEDGLYNSDLADRLIRSHINDYQAKRSQGHLFLPEYGIDNLLTGVMPGSIFGNIFQEGFGVKVSDYNKYRKLFSYQDDADRVFMQTLSTSQQGIMRRNAQAAKLMLSRMPAGPGEYGIGVQNLGDQRAIQRALDMLGVDYSNTIFTDPGLQFKLMTGDYDGDTAWVIRGLNNNQFEKMEAIQHYVQEARQKIAKRMETAQTPEEKKKLENDLDAFTNFGADHFTAQIGMGQATAAIRNALADLSDNDPEKWIAIAEAIDAYDKNTSEAMKEGKIVKLGASASRQSMEGALFRRFIKQITAYGQGSEDARPSIFSSRLPEIRDTGTLFDIVSNFKAKRRGDDVGFRFANDLDSWLFEQYGYSDSFESQAAHAYADMFKNIEGGIRLTSRDDINKARLIAVKWANSLEKDRRANRDATEIAEEEHKLNQFTRRLDQVENSGSLHEDFLSEITKLQKERSRLIQSGVAEDDTKIVGLDKKISLYESLTEDMSQPFKEQQKRWQKELKTKDDEVKKRYRENLQLAKQHGVNLEGGVDAMIGPAMSTDLLRAGKINFSDVSPWMYDELKKKNFKIDVQGYSFDSNGALVKDSLPTKNVEFFPYPHDAEGIRKQRGHILAREMDTAHEWIPAYEASAATVMGSLRHKAFEDTLLEYAKTGKMRNITELYENLLESADKSDNSEFKKLGLSLIKDEATGKYEIKGADQYVSDSVNAALGTWNKKKKRYEGGSLQHLTNYIAKNGFEIANIEGFNINDKGEKMNSRDITADDYSGRGTRFVTTVKDKNGKDVEKVGTFAPDLILRDKSGMYSMLDYKSGQQGAWDSIFQMMVYANDIREKALKFRNSPDQKTRQEGIDYGWDQYLDDNGRLKFKSFFGYDTSSGKGYRFGFNDQAIQEVAEAYKAGINSKLVSTSAADRIAAQRELVSKVAQKYGIEKEEFEQKSTYEAVKTLTNKDPRGEWYSNYIADKFNKDEESLREISSVGYSAIRKYGDREEGGYSKFAAARRTLDEMINPDVIDRLIKQAEDEKDYGAIAALQDYQKKVRRSRDVLNEGELLASQNAYNDIESYMMEQFFGVKESAPLSAFKSVRKKMLDAASLREGMKLNKDAYDSVNFKWIDSDYEKAYNESKIAEAITQEHFDHLLPTLKDTAIKQNNKKLNNILNETKESTVEEDIENYYQQKYDEIEQYVKQQEHDLDEYSKMLNQKDEHGQLVLKKGTAQRETFEALRDNSRNNLNRALDALENKDDLQASAQKAYERSIGLVGGDRVKKTSDKQKEYLDKIQSDYKKAEQDLHDLYEFENTTPTSDDEVNRIKKHYNRTKNKMKEYDQLSDEYKTQKNLEDIQEKIDRNNIDRLYTGAQINRDDQVQSLFLQRKKKAIQFAQTLDKDARTEFWKTHQDSDLMKEAERQVDASYDMRSLQQQQRLDDMAYRQQSIRNRNQHMIRNQYGNYLFGNRSRIVNAYRQAQERQFAYRQQIKDNKRLIERDSQTESLLKQEFAENHHMSYENYQKLSEEEKQKLGESALADAGKIAETQQNLQGYSAAIQDAQAGMKAFSAPAAAMAAGLTRISDAVTQVVKRLGRQLFQKAIVEAKKFVTEFDKSMTTIQMITLKSDSEMAKFGDGLISKAKTLKTSISEVTKVAEILARQGLNDQQINDRLDTIIKFSKVSGANVDSASKLVTVAINTGLVSDAQQATDIVAALGDNAATNAAEIEKGIEKAGAAAAADGTSFAQLAAMLTAITSTTQIGGNVAGRTLNTIFGRMNKIGTNEIIYDENGHAISGSDIAQLLAAQGIRTYDENGNKRSSYDVLYDISKQWESFDDATQQQIANAIAGTRQYSNFSAIMMGMAEGKVDEYMALAEGSEGTVDKKYLEYMKSLEAILNDVKNAWDSVVKDLVDKGALKEIANGFIGLITIFGNIISKLAELKVSMPVIMTLLGALMGLKYGGVGALVGAGLGLAVGASAQASGEQAEWEREQEEIKQKEAQKRQDAIDNRNKTNTSLKDKIAYAKELEELLKEGKLDKSGQEELSKTLEEIRTTLLATFGDTGDAAKELGGSFNSVSSELDVYTKYLEQKMHNDAIANFTSARDDDFGKSKSFTDYEGGGGGVSLRSISVPELGSTSNLDRYDLDVAYNPSLLEKIEEDAATQLESRLRSTNLFTDQEIEIIKQSFVKDVKNRMYNGNGINNRGYQISIDEAFNTILDDILNGKGTTSENIKNYRVDQALKDEYFLGYYQPELEGLEGDEKRKKVESILFPESDTVNEQEQTEKENVISAGVATGARAWDQQHELDRRAENVYFAIRNARTAGELQQILQNNPDIYEDWKYLTTNDPDFGKTVSKFLDSSGNVINDNADITSVVDLARARTTDRGARYVSRTETGTLARQVLSAVESGAISRGEVFVSESAALAAAQKEVEERDKSIEPEIKKQAKENVALFADYDYYKQKRDEIENEKIVEDEKEWEKEQEELAGLLSKAEFEIDETGKRTLIGGITEKEYGRLVYLEGKKKEVQAKEADKRRRLAELEQTRKAATYGDDWYNLLVDVDAILEKQNNGKIITVQEQNKLAQFIKRGGNPEFIKADLSGYSEEARQEAYGREEQKIRSALKTVDDIAKEKTVLTPEQKTAVKTILGEDLGQLYLDSAENGTEISPLLKQYAEATINNAAMGLTGLSSSQRLAGIKAIQEQKGAMGDTHGAGAAFLQGFAGADEYLALRSKDRSKLTEDELKRLNVLDRQLKNFTTDLEISIEVEGVKALEDAGEVLSGTAKLIEQIKKEGSITIQARVEFESSINQTDQQRAMLENGTENEQIATMAQITGWSEAKVRNNMNAARELSKAILKGKESDLAGTLTQMYNSGDENERALAIEWAKEYGYDFNTIEIKGIGPIFGEKTFSAMTAVRKEGYTPEIERSSAFAGVKPQKTAKELAELRRQVISGRLTKESENYDDYLTATEGMGTHSTNYRAMIEANQQAYKNGQNPIYSLDELARERNLAMLEIANAEREGTEQEELADLEASSLVSSQDALKYATEVDRRNNREKMAAQKAYNSGYASMAEMIAGESGEDWYRLQRTQDYLDWQKEFFATDEDGNFVTDENGNLVLKADRTDEEARRAFANLTEDLTGAGRVTKQAKAQSAIKALQSEDKTSKTNQAYISEVFGADVLSQWLAGEVKLTPELQLLADQYATGRGLTTKQKLARMSEVSGLTGQALTDYLALEENKNYAEEVMGGFSGWSELVALREAAGTDAEKFKEMGGAKRLAVLNKQLEEYQKNAEIDFEIEGLSTLEEAGELLEGTTNYLKQLKKDGRFEIQAIVKMTTEYNQQGQIDARLRSSDAATRAQAVMGVTGATEEQYYENQEYWNKRAEKIRNAERPATAASLAEERSDVDKSEREYFDNYVAGAAGYEWIEGRQLRKNEEIQGDYVVDKDNGVVLGRASDIQNGYYRYNQNLIKEAATGKNYSRMFTNTQLAGYAAEAFRSGLGWNEYVDANIQDLETRNALKEYSPDLYKWMNMDEKQRASVEGQNLERKIKLQFEVEDIKQLEEAENLVKGTLESVEKLKGTKIEFTVEMNQISNDAYNYGQLRAKLYNGTREEQRAAAIQITGMTETEFDNGNFDDNIAYAKNYDQVNYEAEANSWMERYKAQTNVNGQQDIIANARKAGYRWDNGRFIFDPSLLYVDYEDVLAGKQRSYSTLELATARERLMSNPNALDNDATLRNAAIQSGGFYFSEYQRRLNAQDFIGAEQIRELAIAEEAEAKRQAEEQDALERAKYGATSVGGAFGYAQLRYQQSNRAGLAANAIYQQLTSGKIENVKQLADIVNAGDVQNWKDLLESSEDVRKAFDDIGVKVGENGELDFSGVEDAGYDAATALEVLTQAVAGASEAYNKQKEVLSVGEKEARMAEYLAGEGNEQKGFEALSEITGNANLAQYIRNRRVDYDKQRDEYNKFMALSDNEKAGYITEHHNTPQNPGEFEWFGEDLSEFEQTYATQLKDNAALGIYGLTSDQRYEGAMEIARIAQQGPEALQELRQSGRIGAFNDYLSGVSDANQILEDLASGSPEKAAKAMERLNEELSSQKAQNVTRYSKGFANMPTILTKMAKGGKEASEATAMLRKNFGSYQDQLTAMNKAKGKKGKDLDTQTRDIIAGMFDNLDADDIKQMTEEQLADLLDGSAEAINRAFTDDLQAAIDSSPVEIDVSNVDVNANGQIDLQELADAYRAAGDEATAQALELAGHYADITFQTTADGNRISVDAIVNTSGKYNNKKGRGGGGKSKADKLLEEQKRKVTAAQHDITMLETEEKKYGYSNDYDKIKTNLNEQIEAQLKLKAIYAENIDALKTQLTKTKEGSDDWYKLKEAIYSAQEAYAAIDNTIKDIEAKAISYLQEEQTNEDKPGTHKQTMLDKLAQRALTEERFSDYEMFAQEKIKEINAQKSLNDTQLAEWEAELANYEEGSDAWIEVRDKIWALEEENAELENQAIQQTLELNEQRLAQIAKVLQYDTGAAVHNNAIASTYGNAYQSGGYRSAYEDMLRVQLGSNKTIIDENLAAEQKAIEQMNSLEKGTAAWYSARAAVYQYQEAIAQTEATQMELNRTLAESNLQSVTEGYEDATREAVHVNEMLEKQAQAYLEANDYKAYNEAMTKYLGNTSIAIDAQREALAKLQDQYRKGMENGTLDPAMQREYQNQINQAESNLQELLIQEQNKQRELDKNNLDYLFEVQDRAASDYNHNLQLVQYQSTRYQNAGELTNYGKAIEVDTELRKDRVEALKDEISALKEQREYYKEKYGEGSDDEIRIVEQIKKREEALEAENTQIEKNNKLLEENEKKIRQVQKTLEDAVDKEIEAQKKREREMLASNVSMQNTILELLKKRLQDEWNLKKKDIEKEKESLNEYKKLINERFNYRKKASQQADKDEELADYRRQLALIEADPSRTKDAKELRRKIEDLEKEQAWTIAEDELNAENERIDEQTQAMDNYVQYNEEKLNEILSDANNFSTDLNNILVGSYEETYQNIIEFMEKENEAFMKSLPDAQKQMIQGWEDTWKKANDIVDSNYTLISSLLQDKDTYMEYMKSTNRDYRSYLENGDENSMRILEKTWSDYYDDWIASRKDDAEIYTDEHPIGEVTSKIDELKDNVFQVNIIGIEGNAPGAYGLDADGLRWLDRSTGEGYSINDYAGIGKVKTPETTEETAAKSKTGTGATVKKPIVYYATSSGVIREANGWENVPANALWASENKADLEKGKASTTTTNNEILNLLEERNKTFEKEEESYAKKIGMRKLEGAYAEGGLVDYTGLAWVDGTKTRPESFLDATDTSLLRSMLDSFNYIRQTPYMSHVDTSQYGNNTTVGDVNITINEAEINNDADINTLAKRIGQAFTKELKINGVSMTGYSFA